jgi:hypothetical protein
LIKKFTDLSERDLAHITETEILNVLPVLQAIDLPVTAEGMRASIKKDMNQTLVGLTAPDGSLQAWIRFGRPGENIFVNSVQLGVNKFNLRRLLQAARPALEAENSEVVVSVVQGGHDAALSLHRKLGFAVAKELPRATRFEISREALLERLKKIAR